MMRVLSVASEVFPLIKTGGLADVAGALPAALKPYGVDMRTLLPGYPSVMSKVRDPEVRLVLNDLLGEKATVLEVTHRRRVDADPRRARLLRPRRRSLRGRDGQGLSRQLAALRGAVAWPAP